MKSLAQKMQSTRIISEEMNTKIVIILLKRKKEEKWREPEKGEEEMEIKKGLKFERRKSRLWRRTTALTGG